MSASCAFCGANGTCDSALLCAVETAVLLDTVTYYGGEEMCSGYVHVREVCAIRLVEIVVGLEEWGTGRRDDGLEERVRWNWGGLKV